MSAITEDISVLMAPETWTPEDVDEWLAEAHDTLRRLHVRDRGPAGLRSSMPEPMPEPWIEALNRVELGLPHNLDDPPPPPSASAIAHLDQVDRWLQPLTVEQRWVVRWRSAGLSWRQVSRSHWRDRGRRHSPETFRARYWGAVGLIVVRLNASKIKLDKLDGLDA